MQSGTLDEGRASTDHPGKGAKKTPSLLPGDFSADYEFVGGRVQRYLLRGCALQEVFYLVSVRGGDTLKMLKDCQN